MGVISIRFHTVLEEVLEKLVLGKFVRYCFSDLRDTHIKHIGEWGHTHFKKNFYRQMPIQNHFLLNGIL